jgi:hypothetical protein
MNNTQTFSTSIGMNNKVVLSQAVGYWNINGVAFPILEKPNTFRRFMMWLLLGWKYIPNTNTKQLLMG